MSWNEEELLGQLEEYFQNVRTEQFLKDLEKSGCFPYVKEVDEE